MLIRCDCVGLPADFQNKTYGQNVRVATPVMTKSGEAKGRCTICSSEKPEFKK